MVGAAQLLLDRLGWTAPGDLTIEEIAWACGLSVERKKMQGCEGRILMTADEAIISIRSDITYQPKINFILAHEICHGTEHRGDQSLFADTDKSLSEFYARGPQEKEANTFAAELLMPTELFKRKVWCRKLELAVIEDAAAYFGASKTAAFLRYREIGDFPVMVILVELGKIKWFKHSRDFPFTWLEYGSDVPAFTVAGDYFYRGRVETKPEKVDAIEWFPEDFQAQKNTRQKLWEQCFPFSNEAVISCLWTA